jgi:hypothetical protein
MTHRLLRIAIAIPLAFSLSWLPAPPEAYAQEDGRSMEELRDQGIAYYKRKRFKLAKRILDQAFATKGGAADFKTVLYRARSAYKLLLLEDAFTMAKAAGKLAKKNRSKRMSTELLEEMAGLYGGVTFAAADGETNKRGRIFFEAKTGIINKEKRQRFQSIRERFRTTNVELPATVYLPYGAYKANEVPFELAQGEDPPTVKIFLQVMIEEGDDDGLLWVYVGAGAAAAAGHAVCAFFLISEPDPVETEVQDFVFQPGLEAAQ